MVDSPSTRVPVAAATGARARAPVNVDVREHTSTVGRLCQAAAAATIVSIVAAAAARETARRQGRRGVGQGRRRSEDAGKGFEPLFSLPVVRALIGPT